MGMVPYVGVDSLCEYLILIIHKHCYFYNPTCPVVNYRDNNSAILQMILSGWMFVPSGRPFFS